MSKVVKFLDKATELFVSNSTETYSMMIFSDSFQVLTYKEFMNEKNSIPIEKLLEVRVFNETCELRMYRDYIGNDFSEFLEISDAVMTGFVFFDDEQFIDIDLERTNTDTTEEHMGMVRATGGGWYRLPFDKSELTNLKVKVRNYIAYDVNGQADIKAWRLVGFIRN